MSVPAGAPIGFALRGRLAEGGSAGAGPVWDSLLELAAARGLEALVAVEQGALFVFVRPGRGATAADRRAVARWAAECRALAEYTVSPLVALGTAPAE